MSMNVTAVMGKNFGDEGKGLAVDWLAWKAQSAKESCLVIRHNGGGQAGHTVDTRDGRFVFHQLSAGSLRDADTFWADRFLPDLYKLGEESEDFRQLFGTLPRVYAQAECRCISIDDVLLNMAVESARGEHRHGSCGMGINEGTVRSQHPSFALMLGNICGGSAEGLYHMLLRIRREYVPHRMAELGLCRESMGEYGHLLSDPNVLYNAAEAMCAAASLITPADGAIAGTYDQVVFEGAQGLLLDEGYLAYAPHLTSSRTGCANPLEFADRFLPGEHMEFLYVSRSYVTRHGAGPLPYEEAWAGWGYSFPDATNQPNPWQGSLRFAPHGDAASFSHVVREDAERASRPHTVSLLLTHLNETQGKVCSIEGAYSPEAWMERQENRETFQKSYTSFSPYAEEIL